MRASARTTTASVLVTTKTVRYVDEKAGVRFASTKVSSVAVRGHSATLRGIGTRNDKRGVTFRVVLVAGKPSTIHVWFGKYVRFGRIVHGTVTVK